jgi:hypothetical protein
MTTLSCLSHVKRGQDTARPDVPASLVIIEAVVDRSGSMSTLGSVPATGVMDFIKQHQTLARRNKTKTLFTLTTFDDTAETPIDAVDMRSWLCPSPTALAQMVYPRGLTRLIDTFMERLHALERRLVRFNRGLSRQVRALKPKVVAILLVITDGQDNMSERFTAADLNKRVKAAKRKGISVLFLGANQDAISTAATFGVGAGAALTFGATPQAAGAAFQAATQVTYRCAQSGGGGGGHANSAPAPAFTQRQRDSSAPAGPARAYTQPHAPGRRLGQRAPFQSPPPPGMGGGGGRGHTAGAHAHWGGNAFIAPAAVLPPNIPPPAALTRMQTVAFTQS